MAFVRTRKIVDDAGAAAVLAAAEQFANGQGLRVVIAVVDPWGELIALRRTAGAQAASSRVAVDKARTAAIFVRPSRVLEEQVSGGRLGALALHGASALTGGIPIVVDGAVVGAVGVSGASSAEEDSELARIAAIAAQPILSNGNGNGAFYFPNASVRDTFRTGGLLLDTAGYKIDAGRREQPGEVEYHERVVDVMRVVEGTATVVTGGTMVETREVAPGELRASSVDGGTQHRLAVGDVLAIPNGVPHQFVDVSDPFLYFVVKLEV